MSYDSSGMPTQQPIVLSEHSVDFIAGLAGGCSGLIFGHPFDTIKVVQQTSSKDGSLVKTVGKIIKNDGIHGFFRGMAFPLVAEGFRNSIFFGVYGNTIRVLPEMIYGERNAPPTYLTIFLAGAIAGSVQAIPACPIELVKVKLQAQNATGGKPLYRGPIHCLQTIHSQYGLRGCFRGLGATISREIPGFSMYITAYQFMVDMLTPETKMQPSVSVNLFAGGMAGMCSWMANIPIDILKSRLQADDMANPKYRNMFDCALKSYRSEGWRVFWRGLPVICIRSFPTNGVTFIVYSASLNHLHMYTRQGLGAV